MKTNLNISAMKNLIVVAVLFSSIGAYAQNSLLAFNSEKKRMRMENKIEALTSEIEKTVRYEAPKVESESFIVETPALVLDDVKELRSWIKTSLEKEALNCNCETFGTGTLSFVVDKNGAINNVTVDNNDPTVVKLINKVMKNAPAVKPLEMNGYQAKQYVKLPIHYKIEQL